MSRWGSREQAFGDLARAAADRLYLDSQLFDDDGAFGCCPACCPPCSALYYLDQVGLLDEVLAAATPGQRSTGDAGMLNPDGTIRRTWMYKAWNGKSAEKCGPFTPAGVPAPDE